MPRSSILLGILLTGLLWACSRPSPERKGQGSRSGANAKTVARAKRPTRSAGPVSGARNAQSAFDRLNQTLTAWVRAADRASADGSVLKSVPLGEFGKVFGTALQSCRCLTQPGWYGYFLGAAQVADGLAALCGRKVPPKVAAGLIQRYNDTASAYNALQAASLSLPLPKVRLSDLDPSSFGHWLHKLFADLSDQVQAARAFLEAQGKGRVLRFELAVRSLWLAERAGAVRRRVLAMSCRVSAPCGRLTRRRDRLSGILGRIEQQCLALGRVTLSEGVGASGIEACIDSWKRLDAEMARTGGGPEK